MSFSMRTGMRPVVASLAVAALLMSASSSLLLAPQAVAAEYRVLVKYNKGGIRTVRMYGSSPYVCTPSGFGQKARCFLRTVV